MQKTTTKSANHVGVDERIDALAARVLESLKTHLANTGSLYMNELQFLADLIEEPKLPVMEISLHNGFYPDCPLYVWQYQSNIVKALLVLFDRGELCVTLCEQPTLAVATMPYWCCQYPLLSNPDQVMTDAGRRRRWVLLFLSLGRVPKSGYWELENKDVTWDSDELNAKFLWT